MEAGKSAFSTLIGVLGVAGVILFFLLTFVVWVLGGCEGVAKCLPYANC